jgi:ATP-binding cassette subfamily B (MDR/TAP) protein 1
VSERVSLELRGLLFKSLIRQDISFYDEKRNGPDKLSFLLAISPAEIGKAFGLNTALCIQAIFTVIVGAAIAFSASWKLSLIVLACFPISVGMSIVHTKAFVGT